MLPGYALFAGQSFDEFRLLHRGITRYSFVFRQGLQFSHGFGSQIFSSFGLRFGGSRLGSCFFGLGGLFFSRRLFFGSGLFGSLGNDSLDHQLRQELTVAILYPIAFSSFFLEDNHFVSFQVLYNFSLYGCTIYSRGANGYVITITNEEYLVKRDLFTLLFFEA